MPVTGKKPTQTAENAAGPLPGPLPSSHASLSSRDGLLAILPTWFYGFATAATASRLLNSASSSYFLVSMLRLPSHLEIPDNLKW